MSKREPKVWLDEDTSLAQPGDFYADCSGTWIIDPSGEWRGFNELTDAEKMLCHTIIRAENAEESLEYARREGHFDALEAAIRICREQVEEWKGEVPRAAAILCADAIARFAEMFKPSTVASEADLCPAGVLPPVAAPDVIEQRRTDARRFAAAVSVAGAVDAPKPDAVWIQPGTFVQIHNGGGRGRVVSGPYYRVQSDQGGRPVDVLAVDLTPLQTGGKGHR